MDFVHPIFQHNYKVQVDCQ